MRQHRRRSSLVRRAAAHGDGVWLAFEVAKDGAGVDAKVARRLRAVAVVSLEHFEHVLPLKLLLRFLEGQDRVLAGLPQIQILRTEQRPLAENQRLLDAVLDLPNVARPRILLDGGERLGSKPLDRRLELVGVLRQEGLRDDENVITPPAKGGETHA